MFKARRLRLMEQLSDECSVFIFSGKTVMKSADEGYPFTVDKNFYYLTGLDREEMILQITKHNGAVSSTLYIQPYDPVMAKWVGGRMSAEEAKKISDVDQICDYDDFEDAVASLYNWKRTLPEFTVYVDAWRYTSTQADSAAMSFVKLVQNKYPTWNIKDVFPSLTAMRMVKDETEVNAIVRANEITAEGVRAMMRAMAPGKREMEMEGVFMLELMKQGCKHTAFSTIAASGKNATVLHYGENTDFCREGDLFLCDLGATYGCYCADISRTFPVNGKFSERQKAIYECVLKAQQIVEDNCRPGITTRQLNQLVIDHYADELPKLGLNGPVSEYYYHGVAHHLGLDTHDVTLMESVLAPGHVITNEPGLYIAEENIGIRIEDDLLVTEDGCRNLSCTPKTVEEIEDIMK
ncbi:MAG: aminopeptidase P family protein [Erysipelotrichaceae bacterium]|nr:aminopeptidase P family protein [Erysipelotrichaceae bacterium]